MTARRVLRLFYHFGVYAIGVVVLLAAVTVTIIRLVLPDIGIYRGEVEAWVSHYMGYPVAIHSLNATWYGWIPHLHLSNIDLLNRAGTQRITHFESAEIRIDPLATLAQRRFVPKQLTISGFKLSVGRLADGAVYIEGIDLGEIEGAQAGDNELAEWLLRQDTIKIEKATVEWADFMHEQTPILLTDVALTLRSDDDRLQIEGAAQLPRIFGNRMDFAFDAHGDLLTAQWSAELYLNASDVNPDHWYKNYRPLNMNIAGGSADIKVWSTWKEARLSKLEGELRYRDFAALIGASSLRVEELLYRFAGERNADGGWRLDMNLNDLVTENGLWPAANIRVRADPVNGGPEFRYKVNFDYLKLDDLVPLVSQLSFVPPAARESLRGLALAGELKHGMLRFDPAAAPAEQFSYDVRFENFSTQLEAADTTLVNASGRVSGSLREGAVRFDGDQGEIQIAPAHLDHLPLNGLRGEVRWTRDGRQLRIASDRLDFATPDFQARVSGNVSAEPGQSPFLDLVVETGRCDLEAIRHYVPDLPGFKLRDWMQRSVLSGELISANALLRGRLEDFPYDDHDGRFQALINAEKIVLEYSNRWPPVDNLSAEIEVQGRTMRAKLRGGRIFNADIKEGVTGIDDLLAPQKTVSITGRVAGTIGDLGLFVDQSPLTGDPFLSRLRTALTGADMNLDLELSVPIRDPDRKPQVAGRMQVAGAQLTSQFGTYTLQDIDGEFEFTQNSVNGSGLRAKLYDRPVDVALSGSKLDPANPPALTISGSADEAFIADRLSEYFPALSPARDALLARMRGGTDWSLKISYLHDPGTQGMRQRLDLTADLEGLLLDLPKPLGKAMNEAVPLAVGREVGGPEPSDLDLQYGSILHAVIAAGVQGKKHFSGAHLHFGGARVAARNDGGVKLSGEIEELSVSEWWKLFRPESGDPGRVSVAANGLSADMKVGALELAGRTFNDVALAAATEDGKLRVRLDASQVAGDIALGPVENGSTPINLQLERLYVSAADRHPNAERMDPRRLPPLNVDIADLRYDDKDLGHLTLNATPLENGISVDRFEFNKPDLTVSGGGTWGRRSEQEDSRFKITLHAAQIDSMLETFGYNVAAITKGETDLAIDADWKGAPLDFALAKINGSLYMQIRKGQLLDVEPKAGRLFGLLSIQALPRRLSLDFSDLFGKGMAFDTIEGNFQVADGDAYTNDLYMRGPSADVTVTGRTGLAVQDYDQVVTVTPQVADTLPVASALFGPVGIGVGAVLYLAGEMFDSIHEKIDRLLRYQYTITGSWSDPVIEKYDAGGQASS